jgi:hypothetical protein
MAEQKIRREQRFKKSEGGRLQRALGQLGAGESVTRKIGAETRMRGDIRDKEDGVEKIDENQGRWLMRYFSDKQSVDTLYGKRLHTLIAESRSGKSEE